MVVYARDLGSLAAREIERTSEKHDELVEWLRLGAHVAPVETARWVTKQQSRGKLPDAIIHRLAELLETDLDEDTSRTAYTALMSPDSLGLWIRLILKAVRPKDDVAREGMHVLGTREEAESFRNRCLKRLVDTPSLDAHLALRSLIADQELREHRNAFIRMSELQKVSAADAAVSRWTEEDILRFERGDEKMPRTLDELASNVIRHLRSVGRLVENEDFSYRDLFTPKTNEREIQLWAASCLRIRARGLYSVERENMLDKRKKVDITALAAGVWQVPIEIKPLGRYSPRDLVSVVKKQLLGRYMLPPDRRYGVLLLVRKQRRRWRLGGKTTSDLSELRDWLQSRATQLAAAKGKVVQVAVIDLLDASRRLPAARRPKPSKANSSRERTAKSTRSSRPLKR